MNAETIATIIELLNKIIENQGENDVVTGNVGNLESILIETNTLLADISNMLFCVWLTVAIFFVWRFLNACFRKKE